MALSGILEDEGYQPREAWDADSCLAQVGEREPAAVVLDIWMEGSRIDGLGVLAELRKAYPLLPVVMISGHGTIEMAVTALKNGAYDFIEKPFNTNRLLTTVQRAMEAGALRRENAALKNRDRGETVMIGRSQVLQQVLQAVDKVAPTNSRVMISGPAGSGKEVVARMIHARSTRSDASLVVVNCAAMSPDRMEEELFGREGDGSNTGRTGLFEMADGGTLLLDEVADMPLETQGKIVRVLQDQTFTRLGGSRQLRVDTRVLAITNRDLDEEISAGRFRQDLYYRLNVVPILLPDLTRRREDIPLLVEHFMGHAAQMAGTRPRPVGEDAMARLQADPWPGNVRQLRNVVDRLLIMAPGEADEPITAEMLPPEIGADAAATLKLDRSGEIMALPLREARETFERDYLLAQLARFGDNISRTAEFIGMERSALHRKLKSLGVAAADRAKP